MAAAACDAQRVPREVLACHWAAVMSAKRLTSIAQMPACNALTTVVAVADLYN